MRYTHGPGCTHCGCRGLRNLDNASFIASLDDEIQPDAAIVVAPEAGGMSSTDAKLCQVGVAELFVEIAFSSVSRDLHSKFDLYRREGVREYIAVNLRDERLHWLDLSDGRYKER